MDDDSLLAFEYTPQEQAQMRATARQSVVHGLAHGCALPVTTDDWPESLQATRACFVTLKLDGDLRGCVGNILASRPLIEEVSNNAYAAAFRDRRFEPLSQQEADKLTFGISVLSEPVPLDVSCSRELYRQLRPGVDGVILEVNRHCGVFLPQVWESLPEPELFIGQLKRKAGILPDLEPPLMQVSTFRTINF